MTIHREVYEQVVSIFKKRFVKKGRPTKREVEEHADAWARDYCEQEEAQRYALGCPSWDDREALILILDAARNLTGLHRKEALRRLKEAVAELEARPNAMTCEDLR